MDIAKEEEEPAGVNGRNDKVYSSESVVSDEDSDSNSDSGSDSEESASSISPKNGRAAASDNSVEPLKDEKPVGWINQDDSEDKATAAAAAAAAARDIVRKTKRRQRETFLHVPSAKENALKTFEEIKECIYEEDWLGETAYEEGIACDCKPDFDGAHNKACNEFSDCINRMTSIECMDDECNCGSGCANQRFQRREYADIDIFETDKKGFGVRANSKVERDQFIYEYVGDVITEDTFRQRMEVYAEQGIKHFYFMMLQQGEFLDATRKGGLGRFFNHSCLPNCHVDKWVVGDKLRMGIFAKRVIEIGEELTFDYNVDRYGAAAQPCYCGEPNCIGYIGGKTQSEARSKLPQTTMEALGLDTSENWETTTARKGRRRGRKVKDDDEDDDDYIVEARPAELSEKGVPSIMSTLLHCKEQWVICKLLSRIEQCEVLLVQRSVMRMHGYGILGSVLRDWKEDLVIAMSILHILLKWPRITKNKISSSSIEKTVKDLSIHGDPKIITLAKQLTQEWSMLEMAYRIPRKRTFSSFKSDSSTTKDGDDKSSVQTERFEALNVLHRAPPKPFVRNYTPQNDKETSVTYREHTPLPAGWDSAYTADRRIYYYNKSLNLVQWEFPTSTETPPATPASTKPDISKIIEEANKALAEKIALKKAEEDRIAQEEAEITEAKRQSKAEAKRRRRERRERRKFQKLNFKTQDSHSSDAISHQHQHQHRHHRSHHREPSDPNDRLRKSLTQVFGKYVPNCIAKYYRQLERDDVKKYAKAIVQIVIDKEIKTNRAATIGSELSDEKKKKVKGFVKIYMDKIMAKKAERTRSRPGSQDFDGSETVVG